MTKNEIANYAGEKISIFKLFIHREYVGTHASPLICESVSHVQRLVENAKKVRADFIDRHGYDYDGEITVEVSEEIVPKVSVGDWLKTQIGNYVYVFKADGINYLGYVLREKKLPRNIRENVRIRSFDVGQLAEGGFIKQYIGQ